LIRRDCHGKQKRVLRPTMIDGVPEDEFMLANADPIWLHQEGLWELMTQIEPVESEDVASASTLEGGTGVDEIPF
jgi:hypothetical protein